MSLSLAVSFDPPRRHPRIAVDLTTRLTDAAGDTAKATIGDLSEGGLFVVASSSPPVGAPVSLRFRLLGTLHCTGSGRVVWRGERNGRAGFGVELTESSKQLTSFARSLSTMPDRLRTLYLAGVMDLSVTIG